MEIVCSKCGNIHLEIMYQYMDNLEYTYTDYRCTECEYMFRISIKKLTKHTCMICNQEYYSTVPKFDGLIYTCASCTVE